MLNQVSLSSPTGMRALGRIGWLRGALGATVAILITGLVGRATLAGSPAFPWLIASMGVNR